jgi:hypothetical protein
MPQHLLLLVSLGLGCHISDWTSPICTSHHSLEDRCMPPHAALGCGISLTFCSGWPWTPFSLIFTSRVAGITVVNRYAQPSRDVLLVGLDLDSLQLSQSQHENYFAKIYRGSLRTSVFLSQRAAVPFFHSDWSK